MEELPDKSLILTPWLFFLVVDLDHACGASQCIRNCMRLSLEYLKHQAYFLPVVAGLPQNLLSADS